MIVYELMCACIKICVCRMQKTSDSVTGRLARSNALFYVCMFSVSNLLQSCLKGIDYYVNVLIVRMVSLTIANYKV